MGDTDSNGPETDREKPATNAEASAPPPSQEAANEVLNDEIESIHAIGEDQ
jgi:hypothetical protein